MGPKLSVLARRSSLRALSIAALLLAACAITASASASNPHKGIWTVRPGKTLHLTDMNIIAGDFDDAAIYVDGVLYDYLGNNGDYDGFVPLGDYAYTPNDGQVHTVTVGVLDSTVSCDAYVSNGPNALASRTAFSISDGGGNCTSPLLPDALGNGNFNGNVSVNRTP